MFGLMFIEMESFKELKQASGYGVDLHIDFTDERWALREEDGDDVAVKEIAESISKDLRRNEAMGAEKWCLLEKATGWGFK